MILAWLAVHFSIMGTLTLRPSSRNLCIMYSVCVNADFLIHDHVGSTLQSQLNILICK